VDWPKRIVVRLDPDNVAIPDANVKLAFLFRTFAPPIFFPPIMPGMAGPHDLHRRPARLDSQKMAAAQQLRELRADLLDLADNPSAMRNSNSCQVIYVVAMGVPPRKPVAPRWRLEAPDSAHRQAGLWHPGNGRSRTQWPTVRPATPRHIAAGTTARLRRSPASCATRSMASGMPFLEWRHPPNPLEVLRASPTLRSSAPR